MAEIEPEVRAFWDELESTDAHIVLWFGRMAADELALYLAISDRLAGRDYSVVDVTALKGMERVSTVQPEILTSLLGAQQRPDSKERQRAADCWRTLRSEDAPFRVVTPEGLVSAPAEHFDAALLAQVPSDWREVSRVVAYTMVLNFGPYRQVGSLMLTARLAALAESGRVELAGHPLERKAMVRLGASG